MLFYTNCTCTWSLTETWFKVWGDEVGAFASKIFCRPRRPLQDVNLGGRRGTHCLREFQYFTHEFRVISCISWILIFSWTVWCQLPVTAFISRPVQSLLSSGLQITVDILSFYYALPPAAPCFCEKKNYMGPLDPPSPLWQRKVYVKIQKMCQNIA